MNEPKSPSEKHRALTYATLQRVTQLLHLSHSALQEAEDLERAWVDCDDLALAERLALDPLVAVMERVLPTAKAGPRPRRVAKPVPCHLLASCTCVDGEGAGPPPCPVHC